MGTYANANLDMDNKCNSELFGAFNCVKRHTVALKTISVYTLQKVNLHNQYRTLSTIIALIAFC